MNLGNKPILELSLEDSAKLFDMIDNGAAPADLFDTFDKDNAYYYIKAGMIAENMQDESSLIARVIGKLGGAIPEFNESHLPPGIKPGSIEAKLMLNSHPQAIAVIHIGRDGERRGFGFDKMDTAEMGSIPDALFSDDDMPEGGVIGIGPDGNMTDSQGRGIPEPVKQALSKALGQALMGGPRSDAAVRVAKINISGGDGEGISIEIDGLEVEDADQAVKLIESIKKATT